MSGNAKQRRVFRRKLARENLTYLPPGHLLRRLFPDGPHLQLPDYFESYTFDPHSVRFPNLYRALAPSPKGAEE